MGIRAVIFDFGGVLVRTEDRHPRTQLAASLGMTYDELNSLIFDSDSSVRAGLGEIDVADHWEAVRAHLAASPEDLPALRDRFWAGDVLDMPLLGYVRSLRPRYKTALLSNAWGDLRAVLERELKITDAFDVVVISAEVGLAKPDARIFQLIAEQLKVAPQEAVFVDDFLNNVEGARAAGMQAIHFQSAARARADIERLLAENAPA